LETNGKNSSIVVVRQSSKQAFAANVKRKGKWAKEKGQGSGEDATRSQKNITCHYCGKVGHMKKHYKKGS
jgi:hypothetical protein